MSETSEGGPPPDPMDTNPATDESKTPAAPSNKTTAESPTPEVKTEPPDAATDEADGPQPGPSSSQDLYHDGPSLRRRVPKNPDPEPSPSKASSTRGVKKETTVSTPHSYKEYARLAKKRLSKMEEMMPEDLTEELFLAWRMVVDLTKGTMKSHCTPFMEKIDSQTLGLWDYDIKVKRPMWFKKILEKFENNEYGTILDVMDDFYLMLENCLRYNGPDHYISKKALKLDTSMAQKISLLPNHLKDRVQFAMSPESGHLQCYDMHEVAQSMRVAVAAKRRNAKKQEILEKRQKRQLEEEELNVWFRELIGQEQEWEEFRAMYELPQIGHMVYLCQEALCFPEMHTHQTILERGFYMPKESAALNKLMTVLLQSPSERTKYYKSRRGSFTYHQWNMRLRLKLAKWYKKLRAVNRNCEMAAISLSIEPRFFSILGKSNPLAKRRFHELSAYQRIWIVKTLIDQIVDTQDSVKQAIEANPAADQTEYRLGTDQHGYTYIHFPQFCGNDIRVYRCAPEPEVLPVLRPCVYEKPAKKRRSDRDTGRDSDVDSDFSATPRKKGRRSRSPSPVSDAESSCSTNRGKPRKRLDSSDVSDVETNVSTTDADVTASPRDVTRGRDDVTRDSTRSSRSRELRKKVLNRLLPFSQYEENSCDSTQSFGSIDMTKVQQASDSDSDDELDRSSSAFAAYKDDSQDTASTMDSSQISTIDSSRVSSIDDSQETSTVDDSQESSTIDNSQTSTMDTSSQESLEERPQPIFEDLSAQVPQPVEVSREKTTEPISKVGKTTDTGNSDTEIDAVELPRTSKTYKVEPYTDASGEVSWQMKEVLEKQNANSESPTESTNTNVTKTQSIDSKSKEPPVFYDSPMCQNEKCVHIPESDQPPRYDPCMIPEAGDTGYYSDSYEEEAYGHVPEPLDHAYCFRNEPIADEDADDVITDSGDEEVEIKGPRIGEFELVAIDLPELCTLIETMEGEGTKSPSKKVKHWMTLSERRKAESDLLGRLKFLRDELEPYRWKFSHAQGKMRDRVRRDYDEYVEPPDPVKMMSTYVKMLTVPHELDPEEPAPSEWLDAMCPNHYLLREYQLVTLVNDRLAHTNMLDYLELPPDQHLIKTEGGFSIHSSDVVNDSRFRELFEPVVVTGRAMRYRYGPQPEVEEDLKPGRPYRVRENPEPKEPKPKKAKPLPSHFQSRARHVAPFEPVEVSQAIYGYFDRYAHFEPCPVQSKKRLPRLSADLLKRPKKTLYGLTQTQLLEAAKAKMNVRNPTSLVPEASQIPRVKQEPVARALESAHIARVSESARIPRISTESVQISRVSKSMFARMTGTPEKKPIIAPKPASPKPTPIIEPLNRKRQILIDGVRVDTAVKQERLSPDSSTSFSIPPVIKKEPMTSLTSIAPAGPLQSLIRTKVPPIVAVQPTPRETTTVSRPTIQSSNVVQNQPPNQPLVEIKVQAVPHVISTALGNIEGYLTTQGVFIPKDNAVSGRVGLNLATQQGLIVGQQAVQQGQGRIVTTTNIPTPVSNLVASTSSIHTPQPLPSAQSVPSPQSDESHESIPSADFIQNTMSKNLGLLQAKSSERRQDSLHANLSNPLAAAIIAAQNLNNPLNSEENVVSQASVSRILTSPQLPKPTITIIPSPTRFQQPAILSTQAQQGSSFMSTSSATTVPTDLSSAPRTMSTHLAGMVGPKMPIPAVQNPQVLPITAAIQPSSTQPSGSTAAMPNLVRLPNGQIVCLPPGSSLVQMGNQFRVVKTPVPIAMTKVVRDIKHDDVPSVGAGSDGTSESHGEQ